MAVASTRSLGAAEAEIERFISRRAEKGESTADEIEEEGWKVSVASYREREHKQLLWERLRYHDRIIESHSSTYELLVERHRREVERLEGVLGLNGKEGENGG